MAHALTFEETPIGTIRANLRSVRTRDARQIKRIQASIDGFGFTNPDLVDEQGQLIADHGRLEAAKRLGLSDVPVIRVVHLSDPEKRALMLADNKFALNAGWEMDILAPELADLSATDLGFEVDLTGFETGEIGLILGSNDKGADGEPETSPVPDPDLPSIMQRGDLWHLGKHRDDFHDGWPAGHGLLSRTRKTARPSPLISGPINKLFRPPGQSVGFGEGAGQIQSPALLGGLLTSDPQSSLNFAKMWFLPENREFRFWSFSTE